MGGKCHIVVIDGKWWQADSEGNSPVLVTKIWKPLQFSVCSTWRKVQVLMVLFGCNIRPTHCTLTATCRILLSIPVHPLSHTAMQQQGHRVFIQFPFHPFIFSSEWLGAVFSRHIMRKEPIWNNILYRAKWQCVLMSWVALFMPVKQYSIERKHA